MPQLLTSHQFTQTFYSMTPLKPSSPAAICLICLISIGIICLTSIILLTNVTFLRAGNTTYQQIKGVAKDSYPSRQIADLVLLLSKFSFFNNTNCPTNSIFVFCRYIDDGFVLTSKNNLPNTGAHNPERATAINSCNGVFTSEFIFR